MSLEIQQQREQGLRDFHEHVAGDAIQAGGAIRLVKALRAELAKRRVR